MVPNRSTARPPRLSHAEYTKQLQRSAAEEAARVPPTRHQFDLALDYGDEITMLDYLNLNDEALHALDATNAFLLRDDRHSGRMGIVASWTAPVRTLRRMYRLSIFQEAALHGWNDVVQWFFASPARISRWGILLSNTLEGMLYNATSHDQYDVIEILLASTVFANQLRPDQQEEALNSGLRHTENEKVYQIFVAHGAKERLHLGASRRIHGITGNAEDDLADALVDDADDALPLLRLYRVVDSSLLGHAVWNANVKMVQRLLVDGFIDVNGHTDFQATPLIECAKRSVSAQEYLHPRRQEVMRTLLKYEADPTLTDMCGRTALHYAIENRDHALVKLLLTHIKTTQGCEAIHNDRNAMDIALAQVLVAETSDAGDVMETLLEHGGCVQEYKRRLGIESTSQCTGCESTKRNKRKRTEDESKQSTRHT